MNLKSPHLLGIEPLEAEEIALVLDTAESFAQISLREIKKVPTLRGKTVVNFFVEPSTRTRSSFEIAEKRLSADSLNFSTSTSSLVKGESLIDTARNLEAMAPDFIVIRHSEPGAPHLLARVCRSSIINAGDGAHEHPTQALLDAFTIRQRKGRLKGLRVAIIGDIAHSRVVRSNIHLLKKMGATSWRRDRRRSCRWGSRTWRDRHLVHGRGARGLRRRHDAPRAARAPEAGILPVDPRVLPAVRAHAGAAAPREGRRHRDAPRTHQPGRRDGERRRRRPRLGDPRSGHERGRGPHGGPLSARGRSHA
jgi:hypothetical protein